MRVHSSYHKMLDEMGTELRLTPVRSAVHGSRVWVVTAFLITAAVVFATYLFGVWTPATTSAGKSEDLSEIKGELESMKQVIRGLVGTVKELAPRNEPARGRGGGVSVSVPEKTERVIATTTSSAELRTAPKSGSKPVGKVPKGSALIVVEDNGSWVQVFGPLGIPGWIEKTVVKLSNGDRE